ncbi:MAG: ABC transporter ATP-binding protein [Firmicutes bacterium]|nr:ABC transporter ATP-binding protein [Bacillota bacterium]
MLEVNNLHVYYGGIHALKGVSLSVPKGEIVTLVGANGAGKSTTLRAIAGLVKPKEGTIRFLGQDITHLPAYRVAQKGISLAPEGRRIFPNLSVRENLAMGAYARKDKAEIQKDLDWVYELFPRLKERERQSGGTLSGGEQQMLAIGRALMSRPALLALDEPSLGLAPLLVKEVFSVLEAINSEGTTILLVEQNANAALKLAKYAYVLETGRVVLEGRGEDLLKNSKVRQAYLGE